MNPPAEYGQIVRELRAIGSNVHQLLLKAIQIKFIDEVKKSRIWELQLLDFILHNMIPDNRKEISAQMKEVFKNSFFFLHSSFA